ncbi:hypothetical protein EHM76_06475, partial [bacterium]
LLPGTSIAGALRNYLRELQTGFGRPSPSAKNAAERSLLATLLFGGYRGDDEGAQSPLVVHDAIGTLKEMELRDGVSINSETRTAKDDQKFDIQLLSAGTTFDLIFELSCSDLLGSEDRKQLLDGLALALQGLAGGEITLGARKRRGFGQCKVEKWSVIHFDLRDPQQFLAWLTFRPDDSTKNTSFKEHEQIAEALGISLPEMDERKIVRLDATFALDGTLLIRSGFGESDTGPDSVHLHSSRKNGRVPVIPGTSWTGVLRHHAFKIARTVWGKDNPKCAELVEGMFGPSKVDTEKRNTPASRIAIAESEVEKSTSLVQTRVKIDRFTGGAYEGALFTEQPMIGKPDSEVKLHLSMRVPHDKEPDPRELGLLLLLLKDLWTGNLPVGGESGIGRGFLKGKEATFSDGTDKWIIREKSDGTLVITGSHERLQKFVDAFNGKGV